MIVHFVEGTLSAPTDSVSTGWFSYDVSFEVIFFTLDELHSQNLRSQTFLDWTLTTSVDVSGMLNFNIPLV